ncbi:MAG: CHASE2 domain-containing protein [Spirulina sp.]
MDLKTTIVLVSSSADPKIFGTGFVVDQEKEKSYIVTCAHVIHDIKTSKNPGKILVGGIDAEVIAMGESKTIDLAVLVVEKILNHYYPLPLEVSANAGAKIKVAGQSEKESKSALVADWLDGTLKKEILLTSQTSSVRGWQLVFDEEDRVEPGYSGGPVLENDKVVAVAAIQLDRAGRTAIAVSIEALREIWQEIPPNLIPPKPLDPPTEPPLPRVESSPSSWLKSKPFFALCSGITVTILVLIFRILGVLETFELALYDSSLRLRQPAPSDDRLTIIEATKEDLTAQRNRNPKEDGVGTISDVGLKEVLTLLSQEEYKPAVIVLDLYRDFQDDPLADTFKQFNKASSPDLLVACEQPVDQHDIGIAPPSEQVVPKNRVGFSNFILDRDNILRRQIIRMESLPHGKCQSKTSLGFLAAIRYLEKEANNNPIQSKFWTEDSELDLEKFPINTINSYGLGGYHYLDPNGVQFLLNYHPVDRYLHEITGNPVSFEKVRNGEVSANFFKDRVVLIGITDRSEAVDYVHTSYGETAGVIIHAHMIAQLLDVASGRDSQIWVWPLAIESLWILIWGLGGGISGIYIRSRRWLIISLGVGCITIYGFGLGIMIFKSGWIPILSPILSFVVTAIVKQIKDYGCNDKT